MKKGFGLLVLASVAAAAPAQMRITEWMYSGGNGEFAEFTNVGGAAIDMSGWSFDDNHEIAGTVDLSGFGVVAAGQSVILTESPAADFATAWNLTGVSIIGDNTANLGRADEINLYDSGMNLVDRLTYDDQNGMGPRTQNVSGNIPMGALGSNSAASAVVSSVGDSYGSWASSAGDVGNPGQYTPVPEPATMAVLGLGLAVFSRRRRR